MRSQTTSGPAPKTLLHQNPGIGKNDDRTEQHDGSDGADHGEQCHLDPRFPERQALLDAVGSIERSADRLGPRRCGPDRGENANREQGPAALAQHLVHGRLARRRLRAEHTRRFGSASSTAAPGCPTNAAAAETNSSSGNMASTEEKATLPAWLAL